MKIKWPFKGINILRKRAGRLEYSMYSFQFFNTKNSHPIYGWFDDNNVLLRTI